MAASYDVKAEVIDIRSDTPKESDGAPFARFH